MSNKQATILIVDDNAVNRTILRDLITIIGHKPVEAADGEAALTRIFRKPHPDMILLDIMMPGVDGYDVLDKVKADTFLRLLPVIMITAVDDIESQIRCIQKGADDYIIKPFNSVLLRARIDALLEKKRLYEQEQQFNLWLAESYQKLQKAENARDSLLHMILHDLNNPICVIKSQAQALQLLTNGELAGDNLVELPKLARVIDTAAGQLQELTGQILDISGLESHTLKVVLEPLAVRQTINEAVSIYKHEVEQAGGAFTVAGNETLRVKADRILLSRMLQNIVVNSQKYAADRTSLAISVQVERSDAGVSIVITDNGPGISEQYQQDVFAKFFRINGSKDNPVKGLGLGLTFCKLAADAMRGSIEISSAPKGGTTVTLCLPEAK